MGFLDNIGLSQLWANIKKTFATKAEVSTVETKVNSMGDTLNAILSAGKVKEAVKATQDGNGNVITDTYATKNHTHSGYLSTNGGTVNGNIEIKDGYIKTSNSGETAVFGQTDDGVPVISSSTGSRVLAIASDGTNDGNYENYYFPEKTGQVLVADSDGIMDEPIKCYDGVGIRASGDIANGFYIQEGYPAISTDDLSFYVSPGRFDEEEGGFWMNFPAKPCRLAAEDDIPHQHDIYIMPGSGNAAGVYIYLTLNTKKSTTYSSVSEVAAELYNSGNNSRYYAVQATGRYGTSSSNFGGIVIGVYATSTTNLSIVYMDVSVGAIGTISYTASTFTSMRDVVR